MEWSRLYNQMNPPTMEDINQYIKNELWQKMNTYLQSKYRTQPKLSYSRCSMQPGWNVKYKKNGKSLCTLYPMDGYFISLVVVGSKEEDRAELMLPTFSEYTRTLYQQTAFSAGGRWLMFQVTEPDILDDIMDLIQVRSSSVD